MPSAPYNCRHCSRPLGRCSDQALTIGSVECRLPITFRCGHCGRESTWRPAKKENTQTRCHEGISGVILGGANA